MPILHSQFRGDSLNSQGEPLQVAPKLAMQFRGPVLQVLVGVPDEIAEQLIQQGLSVPDPIPGYGLIDTGASNSCIDDTTAQILSLPVIDRVPIATPSHDSTLKNVYPMQIVFTGTQIKANVYRAIGASLNNQQIIALIGRDILSNVTLFYNGPSGELTLSI